MTDSTKTVSIWREAREILTIVCILAFALGLVGAISFLRARTTARRNACISVIKAIDGAKDQYALEYGVTNGTLFTWYQLSFFFNDISNTCICPTSPGRRTNTPADCYSIEGLGTNPTCRISRPEDGHALTNR